MADLIDRKAALDALNQLQYWNPEDRFRAVQAVQGIRAVRGEKSADEKFRELGYLWEDTLENGRVYENADMEDAVKVTKDAVEFYCMDGGYHFWAPAKLIRAAAQLIEEMEADSK